MIAEPSFPMVRSVLIPAMDLALKWNVDYDFQAAHNLSTH